VDLMPRAWRALGLVLLSLAVAHGAAAEGEKKAKRPPARSASGTLTAYEDGGRRLTLTLKGGKGTAVFSVTDATRVLDGARALDPDRLGELVGARVAVRYTDKDGAKVATRVRVKQRPPA
jgi:hypothetical protein